MGCAPRAPYCSPSTLSQERSITFNSENSPCLVLVYKADATNNFSVYGDCDAPIQTTAITNKLFNLTVYGQSFMLQLSKPPRSNTILVPLSDEKALDKNCYFGIFAENNNFTAQNIVDKAKLKYESLLQKNLSMTSMPFQTAAKCSDPVAPTTRLKNSFDTLEFNKAYKATHETSADGTRLFLQNTKELLFTLSGIHTILNPCPYTFTVTTDDTTYEVYTAKQAETYNKYDTASKILITKKLSDDNKTYFELLFYKGNFKSALAHLTT